MVTAAKQSAKQLAPIAKDALYPGRWRLPDGRTFLCQPEDLPHYAKRFKEWLAAKLPIPVRWEHELEGQSAALSAADKAKNTIAHAVDAAVHADGYLEVKFPSNDEDDRKRLGKVKFVSPTIKYNVVDSTGKLWPGPSITELAVTPVPIQHGQKPFNLSQQLPATPAPIFLSVEAYEPLAGQKPVRLAQEYEAEAPEAEPSDSPPKKPKDEEESQEAEEEETGGLAEKLSTALECLKRHGIVLGEETGDDLETFLDHIITACRTKEATENPTELEGSAAPAGNGQETPTEAQPPIMMSGALAKVYKDNLQLRIENLWAKKQITKPMKDKLLGRLNTVKLSMTAAGEPIEEGLLAQVAAYEELPENYTAFQRTVDLSRANEVDPPSPAESDHRRQQEAGSEMASLANGKANPRKNSER